MAAPYLPSHKGVAFITLGCKGRILPLQLRITFFLAFNYINRAEYAPADTSHYYGKIKQIPVCLYVFPTSKSPFGQDLI